MALRVWMIGLLVLLGAAASHAGYGRLANGSLDQKALRKAYTESEFERVRNVLEAFRKDNFPQASREDWVFTYKYLGVIYASDSSQTVRAESNFNQLLHLAPNIELVDMFVPPKIQALFDRLKSQYLKDRDYSRRYDELGDPIQTESGPGFDSAATAGTASNPNQERKSKSSKKKGSWAWWATMGAVIGVGTGYYIWYEYFHDQKPNKTSI